MTTLDNPSIAQLIIYKIGRKVAARNEARARARTGTWVTDLVRLMLHLAGFGCLTYAGFQWSTMAGFIVAGLSFFVLSALSTGHAANPQATPVRDPMADRRN